MLGLNVMGEKFVLPDNPYNGNAFKNTKND